MVDYLDYLCGLSVTTMVYEGKRRQKNKNHRRYKERNRSQKEGKFKDATLLALKMEEGTMS